MWSFVCLLLLLQLIWFVSNSFHLKQSQKVNSKCMRCYLLLYFSLPDWPDRVVFGSHQCVHQFNVHTNIQIDLQQCRRCDFCSTTNQTQKNASITQKNSLWKKIIPKGFCNCSHITQEIDEPDSGFIDICLRNDHSNGLIEHVETDWLLFFSFFTNRKFQLSYFLQTFVKRFESY